MAKNKYTKMWNFIHEELLARSEVEYGTRQNELNLMVAIVIQAAKDRDYNYFKSDDFYFHCKLLRINFMQVSRVIKSAYEIEDNNLEFNLPYETSSEIGFLTYDDEEDDDE